MAEDGDGPVTLMPDGLRSFVRESNAIEGILRNTTRAELDAHHEFLALEAVTVPDLARFVEAVAHAPLRDRPGMNVRVGDHLPPPGGPEVYERLRAVLAEANAGTASPYLVHQRYEALHPFMDGNGRSGRALWAWQMPRHGRDPFALPFLHLWYYQSLDGHRH